MAHKASDTTNGSRGRAYLSRFAFHAIPGKTGEVEIQKLRRVLPKSKTFRHVVQSDGLVVETTARIG